METPRHWPAELKRTLIIGNSGAGETWLARELGALLSLPIVNLDDLHWKLGRYGVARNKKHVAADALEAARAEAWVMEGVYGWLAEIVLERVTKLIWIDLQESECISNIEKRGI